MTEQMEMFDKEELSDKEFTMEQLEKAKQIGLSSVIIAGFTEEGQLYLSSSTPNLSEIVLLSTLVKDQALQPVREGVGVMNSTMENRVVN